MSFNRSMFPMGRRYRGGRAGPRRRKSTSQVGRLKKRISKIEKGYGKELKVHDTNVHSAVVTNASTIVNLTNMAQGDTSLLREGLKIAPRNLQYKVWVQCHASATASLLRMIIFKDREQHGTAPVATDLLETDNYLTWKETDHHPRFKIYRDMMIPLDNVSSKSVFVKGIIKFGKKSKVFYGGTDATAASQGKNSMYMLLIGNEATNYPTAYAVTRLRFTE